ncbi:MAG: NAD-dependent epimerase/dehydratase family protein [Clostridia bacterium]|jgi:dihydroflavonol-4-reductase|nr:NAD-dependent epimerase/dehydratase family protein [Clostridia bacterium]
MFAVTGATGHLGNNLVRILVSRGYAVRALVLPGDSLRPLEGLEVEIVEADVRDLTSLERAFRGAEGVFHLASVISLAPGDEPLLEAVNVGGTANVVEACRRAGVRRLVYVSSIHALREPAEGGTVDETCFAGPADLPDAYSRTKARATELVLGASGEGLECVVVAPTGLLGPYDYAPSLMGRAILDVARGKFAVTFDGGYDFADARDVAEGIVAAWLRGRPGQLYLLPGEWVSVPFLVNTVCRLAGRPLPRVHLPYSFMMGVVGLVEAVGYRWINRQALKILATRAVISSEKARSELGYRSRPVAESLEDTLAWFEAQGWLRGVRARAVARQAGSAGGFEALVMTANRVIEAGQACLNLKLRGSRLTGAEANVLMFLYTHGEGVIQEDIVTGMELTRPAISRTLRELERKGYVHRYPAERDRRSRQVFLTDRAFEEKARVEEAYRQIVAAATEGIPEEKAGEFLGYLRRVAENLDAYRKELKMDKAG